MSRLFYHVMQDNAGNLLFDVSGTMRLAGTGTLATIYGDEALTVILPNPMTNHPSFGSFKCFLPVGDYDFYMAKAGYTFETLTGVQGYGSMAQQDAGAVAITGGTAALEQLSTNRLDVPTQPGSNIFGYVSNIVAAGGTDRWNMYLVGDAPAHINGPLRVGLVTSLGGKLNLFFDRAFEHGIALQASADTGATATLAFLNTSATIVGSITQTATTTGFNTTSDARLKHAVATLVGELAVIRALRPVRFRWLSNDSEGVGFIAQEVAEHVQGVVTGEPDAVDDKGRIVPQMIDMSRLVPWLVGALQTLAGQVETLTERVQALEEGLGV